VAPERDTEVASKDEVQVRRTVTEGANELGVPLSAGDVDALLVHYRAMMKWRRRADLTALVDPVEIGVRHYLDSLTLVAHVPPGAKVADLGTGAGFPGVPLGIARPDVEVTLLETREVKLAFLHHVIIALRRPNLRVARTSERLETPPAERFGLVVARAVADIGETLERCADLLRPDGQVWVMRGPSRLGEADEHGRARYGVIGELNVVLPVEAAVRRIVMYQRRPE
jgi:16S rRNA (guanine527-N7)-methyltransferase